jgi:hypothetical protein
MQVAIEQFRLNAGHVRHIQSLHAAFGALTTSAIDLSDILRTQLVMIVSAMDHYVHEVARIGMLEIIDGRRPSTPSFQRFSISLGTALQIPTALDHSWLDSEIRMRHGHLTFQQPDKIADAIRLISSIELWTEIAQRMAISPQQAKSRLQLIVERRNKIAHEADVDPTYPGSGARWPITPTMVADSTTFIESLCENIHELVK